MAFRVHFTDVNVSCVLSAFFVYFPDLFLFFVVVSVTSGSSVDRMCVLAWVYHVVLTLNLPLLFDDLLRFWPLVFDVFAFFPADGDDGRCGFASSLPVVG